MSNLTLKLALFSTMSLAQLPAYAEITGTDILNILVEEKIISEEKAKSLADKVKLRNQREKNAAAQPPIENTQPETNIQYVPEFVKESIKDTVTEEVLVDIEETVARRAKEEGWVVNQSPSWVKKVKISGDMRLRYQQDIYPSGNTPGEGSILNYNAVNANGSIEDAGRNAYLNTTEDQERLRTRARLQIVGKPTKKVNLGFRLVTGNADDPTSSNQTVGTYNQKWDANFDLAYLELKDPGQKYRFVGGRFKNPWVGSDLIWDNDVTFGGLTASYSPRRFRASLYPRSLVNPFVTVGAFPVQQISLNPLSDDPFDGPDDKWLYAAQVGNKFRFNLANSFDFAVAYYKFDNVQGKRNNPGSDLNDATAPEYLQFGNSVFDIATEISTDTDQRYALASEFELINVNFNYVFSGMLKHNIGFNADWVLNTAFDRREVNDLTGNSLPDRDQGYQIGFNFGTKQMNQWKDWNLSFAYRHLEGDAVIDGFADSDFLLGGTNARGYIIKGGVALTKGTVLSLKWLTASEIDAINEINVDVDRLQLDVSSKF